MARLKPREAYGLLFLVFCLMLLVSSLDYQDARTRECADKNLQYDYWQDVCFNHQPGDQNAKTKKSHSAY